MSAGVADLALGQVLEEVEERRLGPMDVLDKEDDRASVGERLHEPSDAEEGLGKGEWIGRESDGRGDPIGDLVVTYKPEHLRTRLLGMVILVDVGRLADDLDDRPERDPLTVRQAPPTDAQDRRRQRVEELLDEAGLPNARVADDRDHPEHRAADDGIEGRPQSPELVIASDQRDRVASDRRPALTHGEQPIGADQAALALELERLDRLDLDGVAHEAVGQIADEDLARRRGLFQPRRGVDRVAGHEPLSTGRIAGDDLARIHACAVRQTDAERPLELTVESRQLPAASPRPPATARSASSSWTVGSPKTAMIASPMYFSTVPPCRSSSERIAAK